MLLPRRSICSTRSVFGITAKQVRSLFSVTHDLHVVK
jgi:hypothetical protein